MRLIAKTAMKSFYNQAIASKNYEKTVMCIQVIKFV